MEKYKLERFIQKYNLSGASESVELKMVNGELSTRFASDDANCLGNVSTNTIPLDDGEYRIMYTATLLKMLAVLGDTITVAIKKFDTRPIALVFSDDRNKVAFTLAEITPTIPTLSHIPNYEVEIILDPAFTTAFVKAKGAMNDIETFTVLSDGTKVELSLGHSNDHNSNSVTLSAIPLVTGKIKPISFSSKYLRDIIMANKEATGGVMRVAEEGLAHITFNVDDFTVEYWLTEKE